jgi:DNA-binding CsgD family transcriptional regulator
MRFIKNIKHLNFSFIIIMSLYLTWRLNFDWVNHMLSGAYYKTAPASDAPVINYVLFFLFHSLGIALFALWLDRFAPSQKAVKTVSAVFIVIAAVSGGLSIFCPGQMLWLLFSAIGLLTGCLVIIPLKSLMNVPLNERGINLGIAFVFAYILNYLLFNVFVTGTDELSIFIITGITAFLLVIITIVQLFSSHLEAPKTLDAISKPLQSTFWVLAGISLLFFASVGIQAASASSIWLGGNKALVFSRWFSVLGFLAAGWLTDRFGRAVLLSTSITFLAFSSIMLFFSNATLLMLLFLLFLQIGRAGYEITIRLFFLDNSKSTRYSNLTAGLGFIMSYVFYQAGAMIWLKLAPSGNLSVFVAAFVLIILCFPFIPFLYNRIKLNYMVKKTVNHFVSLDINTLKTHYSLTVREAELLEIILKGQSIEEMSQNLCISIVTVKRHIGNILKKTETKNRVQLISKLTRENFEMNDSGLTQD